MSQETHVEDVFKEDVLESRIAKTSDLLNLESENQGMYSKVFSSTNYIKFAFFRILIICDIFYMKGKGKFYNHM